MIGPLPPRPTGSSAAARFQQAVWDALFSGQPTVRQVPNAKVSRTTRGMIVEPTAKGGGGGTGKVTQLILADYEAADYLICRPWNSDYWQARFDLFNENGSEPSQSAIAARMDVDLEDLQEYLDKKVYVAKPFYLRADVLDGKKMSYLAEDLDEESNVIAETRLVRYEYHSSTLRRAFDITDPDSIVEQTEIVIPHFAVGFDIIYAASVTSLGILDADGGEITLLDTNNQRAWMRVPG